MESCQFRLFGTTSTSNEVEATLYIYSTQSIICSLLRIAVAVYISLSYNLLFPIVLLTLVGISRIVLIIENVKINAVFNQCKNDTVNRPYYISKIDTISRAYNFFVALLPYYSQFIIAFYIMGLFTIYAYNSNHRIVLLIVDILFSGLIGYCFYSMIKITFTDWWEKIKITKDTIFTRKTLDEDYGLTVVFWSGIYFICSIYFCYHAICNPESIINIIGGSIFTFSTVQSLKMINFYNLCWHEIENARLDIISYWGFLMQKKIKYFQSHKKKFITLFFLIPVLVLNIAYIIYEIQLDNNFDFLASLLCLALCCTVIAIYTIRKIVEVPSTGSEIYDYFED